MARIQARRGNSSDVRRRGDEVHGPGRAARLLGDRWGGADLGDQRRLAGLRFEVALGGQLVVRVGDDAARDPQVRGQPAGGWQPGARREPAVLDRLADRAAQVAAELAASKVEVEEHVSTARGLLDEGCSE